ncbi:hypothetical protein [Nocardioides houyundeii]|uniref:hypothetical protein n=1 Tax=Nocardioides houyundeii TaxID=2045452 RepID=UPI001315973D|nr:hypothetical protein [Nocardioides houyundeii]
MSQPPEMPDAPSSSGDATADDENGTAPEQPNLAGVDDDQLPEDLRPEENPLARPLDPDDPTTRSPEELDLLGDEDQEPGQS